MEQIGDARRLIETILQQTDSLLENFPSGLPRERLDRIRHASVTLLALVAPDNGSQSETPPSGEPDPAAVKAGQRILLVEDNPFTQKLMTRLLFQQGYEVSLAQNGQDALDLLNTNEVDLILMDLRMPVLDGFLATMEIRQREAVLPGRHTPIIAVTALTSEEDQHRVKETGMDDYHAKPVRAAVLFAQMERLLTASTPTTTPAQETEDVKGIVDMPRLLKTVDGDLDLLKEIVDLYFVDAPRQMSRIELALAKGDSGEVREAAHSLKGATGAFGRVFVHELAFSLEQAGRLGEMDHAWNFWRQLGSALATLEETIKKEIAHLSGESS
ncbi:MAG: response regulator [Magnetococcales bacterium]|nr:response regulator [Magnetococcales bacterium]